MEQVKTDCCGNTEEYLIGNTFEDGRVRVEGNCPVCGAKDPLGYVVSAKVKA